MESELPTGMMSVGSGDGSSPQATNTIAGALTLHRLPWQPLPSRDSVSDNECRPGYCMLFRKEQEITALKKQLKECMQKVAQLTKELK